MLRHDDVIKMIEALKIQALGEMRYSHALENEIAKLKKENEILRKKLSS